MAGASARPERALPQQLGYLAKLLGCHFPLRNRLPVLREPLQSLDLPAQAFVVNDHSQFFWQAWELVLQHPDDLVDLSKLRLPAVLMDIDDEQLCFVNEQEPISVDGLLREQASCRQRSSCWGRCGRGWRWIWASALMASRWRTRPCSSAMAAA